jgi:hypothetical protein
MKDLARRRQLRRTMRSSNRRSLSFIMMPLAELHGAERFVNVNNIAGRCAVAPVFSFRFFRHNPPFDSNP